MKNSLAPSVSLNAKDPKIANLSFILYPDHLTEEITNGIKTENNPESLIKLYPQPAYERLYINSPVNSTIHWSVSDLFGRVLIYSSTRTEFINISGFAAGMYLFRYTDRNGNTGTIKFIKE